MMTERVYPRDYDSPPVSGEHAMRPPTGGHHHRLLSQDSLMSKDSYAYNSGPPSGTFVIQVPKDQIYRVPPPENEYKFKRYTKAKKNRSCCRRCICTTICFLLMLALLASATAGVFYLIFRPESPGFDVVGMSVRGVNVTADAAGAMKPVFQLTVRSKNGNGHLGIYYMGGDSVVEVFHDGDKLASGKIPEFYSRPGDERVFEIVLSGGEIVLSDPERTAIKTEEKYGRVPLLLGVKVPVKMNVGNVNTWALTLFLCNKGNHNRLVSFSGRQLISSKSLYTIHNASSSVTTQYPHLSLKAMEPAAPLGVHSSSSNPQSPSANHRTS